MTNYEHHKLTIIYEEATARNHNSAGAWHVELFEFVLNLGYDVRNYQQALNVAEQLLFGGY